MSTGRTAQHGSGHPAPPRAVAGATPRRASSDHRRRAAASFAAGAAAVLTTHQLMLWALHRAGWAPWPPYARTPTPPFGVPAVLSAAWWGGVWWVALAPLVARAGGRTWAGAGDARRLAVAAALGATLPNLVGVALVAAGHGVRVAGAGRGRATVAALVINAAWGITAAALAARLARGRGASRGC